MERLKQIFNKDFNPNQLNLTSKQADLIITVWAEHFKKPKPVRTCKEQVRSYAIQLYNEYKSILSGKETLKEKLEKVGDKPKSKPVKNAKKQKNENI